MVKEWFDKKCQKKIPDFGDFLKLKKNIPDAHQYAHPDAHYTRIYRIVFVTEVVNGSGEHHPFECGSQRPRITRSGETILPPPRGRLMLLQRLWRLGQLVARRAAGTAIWRSGSARGRCCERGGKGGDDYRVFVLGPEGALSGSLIGIDVDCAKSRVPGQVVMDLDFTLWHPGSSRHCPRVR